MTLPSRRQDAFASSTDYYSAVRLPLGSTLADTGKSSLPALHRTHLLDDWQLSVLLQNDNVEINTILPNLSDHLDFTAFLSLMPDKSLTTSQQSHSCSSAQRQQLSLHDVSDKLNARCVTNLFTVPIARMTPSSV